MRSWIKAGIWVGLILCSGVTSLLAQGGVAPRHVMYSGYPSMPMVSSSEAERLQDTMRDYIPTSTGHLYYNTTAGNPFGTETQRTKSNWLDKTFSWLSTGVGTGADQLGNWLARATSQIDSMVSWVDAVQPQVLIPTETVEDFQRALEAYKLWRRFDLMKRSWHGSVFKLDLLDLLPVWANTELDQFGVAVTGVRVGLTYKDSASSGDILSASGDNPFIGDWNAPRIRYQGPHKLDDIGLNLSASPYMNANQKAIIQIGKDSIETLDRTFFEGIMGRSQADHGLAFAAPEDGRPSPQLIKANMTQVVQQRQAQIDQEIKVLQQLYADRPVQRDAMIQSLLDESAYWEMMPDLLSMNQKKRIERLRNVLAKVHNVTVERESKEAQQGDAMPESSNGFFDSAYNTYKTVGDLSGELVNAATGVEEDTGDSGAQIQFKARVQYAKATHGAFAEAMGIRKIVHNKLKDECQQRMADGFIQMKQHVQRFAAKTGQLEAKVEAYERRANELITKMWTLGMTPESLAQAVRTP